MKNGHKYTFHYIHAKICMYVCIYTYVSCELKCIYIMSKLSFNISFK